MVYSDRISCPYCGKLFRIHPGRLTIFDPVFFTEHLFRKQVFYCDECHAVITYDSITKKVTAKKLDPKDKKIYKGLRWNMW